MSCKEAKAFVLEPVAQDVSGAQEFGKIVYVYENNDKRPPIWSTKFVDDALRHLREYGFDVKRDYFVVTGRLAPLTLLITNMLIEYGTVRLLLFSAPESRYTLKVIGDRRGPRCNCAVR